MNLLTPVATLASTIGFDVQEPLTTAMHSAIIAAGEILAAELSTDFDAATGVADKFILRSVLKEGPITRCRIRLSQCFITAESTVVKLGDTLEELADAVALIEDTDYEVDHAKGLIILYGTELQDTMCHVTYDHGFALGTGGESELYQDVPTWLTEAALSTAVLQLFWHNQQYKPANFSEAEAQNLKRGVDSAIARKMRRGVVADTPM